jgi:16S rRNA (guanine966-N2)-methyltransferase
MNSVRIIAGRWKGRALEVPPGSRPTSARAREALFSIVRDSVTGSRFLDLYAGSGAMGLEAVSRGAARTILVEEKAAVLDRNVARLGAASPEVEVLRGFVAEALELLCRRSERFDLIFCDPPYGSPADAILPPTLGEILAPGGLVVVQTDAVPSSLAEPPGWTLLSRRPYGRNVFLFFCRCETLISLPIPGSFDGSGGKC